jgi:hypothetical protein
MTDTAQKSNDCDDILNDALALAGRVQQKLEASGGHRILPDGPTQASEVVRASDRLPVAAGASPAD